MGNKIMQVENEDCVNIHKKIQQARTELKKIHLEKSGYDEVAKRAVYTFEDIKAAIELVSAKYKIIPFVVFNLSEVTLTLIDAGKPEEKVLFQLPIKGYNKGENICPIVSRLRCCLYLLAFDIK